MIKKTVYTFFFFVVFTVSVTGQTAAKKEIFNKVFNWTIVIPEGFEGVSNEDQKKIEEKGKEAIENTYGQDIGDNQTKNIFIFKKDKTNYFEANYLVFNPAVDGDYTESCKAVYEILYETFKSQLPNAKIDKIQSTEKIDGLEFHVFTMKIELQNKTVMTVKMYNHLFGKNDLSVNFIYLEEAKGIQMLDALRKSKFKK